MEDVSIRQPKDALQIQGREALSCDDACLETWRIAFDRIDHQIRDSLAMLLPGRAVGKLRAYMLTEQGRHMGASRRQAVIECRGNNQFNNWAAASAMIDAIAISFFHIGKARSKDDPGCVMIAGSRQCSKIRKF
jgi:hypothetical protein